MLTDSNSFTLQLLRLHVSQQNADALASLGVEIEYEPPLSKKKKHNLTWPRYIPVFLGGINVGRGNKPPWTLPAKAAYSTYDGKRAQKYFGHDFEVPAFFPILSLLPQRALTYIKRQHAHKLIPAFRASFETMWNGHLDISRPENLAKALGRTFSGAEVEEILAAATSPEIKKELTATTARVVNELGAFGCPWFWVTNGEGKPEPFFGSDRFHLMWDFLELPHEDLRLRVEGKAKL